MLVNILEKEHPKIAPLNKNSIKHIIFFDNEKSFFAASITKPNPPPNKNPPSRPKTVNGASEMLPKTSKTTLAILRMPFNIFSALLLFPHSFYCLCLLGSWASTLSLTKGFCKAVGIFLSHLTYGVFFIKGFITGFIKKK